MGPPDRIDGPFDPTVCVHDYRETYYGHTCSRCGDFVPFGCEPWAPDDDEVADMVREAMSDERP